MTTILLIRHGENDSVGQWLPGRKAGLHLNFAGLEQAQQIAHCLEKAPITGVISSPMERAIETAVPLAQVQRLTVEIRNEFIEMEPGEWTGRKFTDLVNNTDWLELRKNPAASGFPGGETFAGAQKRLWKALRSVIHGNPDGMVAIFSHADCIRLLTTKALGIPLKRFNRLLVDTASLTVLSFADGRTLMEGQNIRLPYSWQPRT
jgi:broad specificity phosphatase PhoE